MTVKALFIAASIAAVLGLAAVAVYFLRQAAAEAAATNAVERAVSECAGEEQEARSLVMERAGLNGNVSRVVGTTSHYNMALHQCYVDVVSEEIGEHPLSVKTLINTTGKLAILWSVKERSEAAFRQCFGQDATRLDCTSADRRWEELMRN